MAQTQTEGPKNSRVGKQPVPIPQGVQVTIGGKRVTVKGPKGEVSRTFPNAVDVVQKEGKLHVVARTDAGKEATQFQGLTRALLNNMVKGVHEGYKKSLDFYGVGYRAELKGDQLSMALGLSHGVQITVPKAIKVRVETIDEAGTKRPRVHLESHDKDLLGQIAARIRSFRPPEPYKGKGVRYTGERVREKAGKAGKGAK